MVAHAGQSQLPRDVGTLRRSCGREALSEPSAPGVHVEQPPGLGIDEPERSDVRQLLLTLVADLERDDVVTSRELEQRPSPVPWASEVGDEHDEAPLARERPGTIDRFAE